MNELTVKSASEIVKIAQEDWGVVGEGQLTIRCTVGQPTSRGNNKSGLFNFSNDWHPQETLKNLVVLFPHKTRVLFGPTFDSPARCSSDNYHVPSPRIQDPINDVCADCYASKWESNCDEGELELKHKLEASLNRTKPSKAPACTPTINLIVVDDRMMPFSLKFQKTQEGIITSQLINRIKFSGKRPYQIMFDLGLKKNETAAGVWFEYAVENVRPVASDQESKYKEMWDFFHMHGEAALADQHASLDQEKVRVVDGSTDEEIPF